MPRVVVVGAGQMGAGIARVAAQAAWQVFLTDADKGRVQRVLDSWAASADVKLETISRANDWSQVDPGVDLVIEAVAEAVAVKSQLFQGFAGHFSSQTILASNTSSISITTLGAACGADARVVGMHFMNPVRKMALVEVVAGLRTSPDTVDRVCQYARAWGKIPVPVQDAPGFVANRLLLPMINEAIFVLSEGVADRDRIDQVMRLGAHHPMGPLELADFIGLDTCLAILDVMAESLGDPKYQGAPLLREMVAAGNLGRKTGRGFYVYG